MNRPADPAARRWWRNLAFLPFSFANTAAVTVFPQHHFWRDPQGEGWTAAVLLGEAVAALLGVWWAARRTASGPRRAALAAGCLLFAGLLLAAGADGLARPVPFAGLMWALAFVSSALMQRFDAWSVQQAGADGRVANDLGVSLLRFMGMLLAPCAFSLVAPGSAAAVALSAALAAAVGASGWRLLVDAPGAPGGAPSEGPSSPVVDEPHAAAPWTELALWLAGVLVYADYCVLASAAPYLLRDLVAQPGAMARAWLLVAGVYASAMACNVLVQWRRWRPRLAWTWGAPAVLALAGACLRSPAAARAPMQALASAALGAAFALFLMGYRDHLTRQAVHHGRPALLARYNQMPRWATLLAFAAMALVALLAGARPAGVADGVVAYLRGSALLVLAGMLALASWRGRRAG